MPEDTINTLVDNYLNSQSIKIIGFADLSSIPAIEREYFPFGVVFGIPYSREGMIENLQEKPRICYDEYNAYNDRMADVAMGLAEELVGLGYRASAKTRSSVAHNEDFRTVLPYKTVARLAGLGWIGKCALLVTEKYGSALRMNTVLTNAPLDCDEPIITSRCPDDCLICKDACPGNAPSGKTWKLGMDRADFFDAVACDKAALRRSKELLGIDIDICALCMSNCPFTRKALDY